MCVCVRACDLLVRVQRFWVQGFVVSTCFHGFRGDCRGVGSFSWMGY